MKLSIDILKEDPQELAEYQAMMVADEKAGNFTHDHDVVDPNTYDPVDENFPYIRRGFKWWWKQHFWGMVVRLYSRKINRELLNLKVEGRGNLRGVKAAIVTCNHISKVDSFAVRGALRSDVMYVGAEWNNWRGYMGELARNTGYIALPSSMKLSLMRNFTNAIKYYLGKGKKILIYPEQAMWREYRKPRPLRPGAFHYAVQNNVPIIPMFITIKDKPQMVDANGKANFGDYTIHILPPIYPDPELSVKDNEQQMQTKNAQTWREVYERVYQKPLVYEK